MAGIVPWRGSPHDVQNMIWCKYWNPRQGVVPKSVVRDHPPKETSDMPDSDASAMNVKG